MKNAARARGAQRCLDPAGAALTFSTYLGGSAEDDPFAMVRGGNGELHVVGGTFSSDFPVVAPFQASLAGAHDAFVATISPAAGTVLQSSYLGGSRRDTALEIALGPAGSLWVGGWTDSPDFPVAGAPQPGSDA